MLELRYYNDLKTILTRYIESDIQFPIFIWGEPGIGKTAIIHSLTQQGYRVYNIRISQLNPEDIVGIPNTDGSWIIPKIFKEILESNQKTVLFFDEINMGPDSVLKMVFNITDRTPLINGFILPNYVKIIVAGNDPKSNKYAKKLAIPLRNRFAHILFNPDRQDVISYFTTGYNLDKTTLDEYKDDVVDKFDPKEIVAIYLNNTGSYHYIEDDKYNELVIDANTFPTPRSYSMVIEFSKILPFQAAFLMSVGDYEFSKFKAVKNILIKLKDIDKHMSNGTFPGDLDDSFSTQIALAIMIAYRYIQYKANDKFKKFVAQFINYADLENVSFMFDLMKHSRDIKNFKKSVMSEILNSNLIKAKNKMSEYLKSVSEIME